MNWTFSASLFAVGMLFGIAGMYLHGRLTRDVKVLLAFSGAYLLALSLMHLLPEIYLHLGHRGGLYIIAGFLVQMIMDYFSRGAEHGHIHLDKNKPMSFPLGIFLSLFLHSVLEGLPLGGGFEHHHGSDHLHPESLLLGIAIHKVPEALTLAAILYHIFERKSKVLLYIFIYAIATPIGIFIGSVFQETASDSFESYSILLALAVGIFLHVSTTIIFEADESHRLSWPKVAAILLGLSLAFLM
jgi:zinc transporter ZupT